MDDKKQIYIWGTGIGLENVFDSIDLEQVCIKGLIDNDVNKVGRLINGYEILSPDMIDISIDYIIISSINRYNEIKKQLIEYGYNEDRIFCYYDKYELKFDKHATLFNTTLRTCILVKREMSHFVNRMNNLEYEVVDRIRDNKYSFPIIRSGEECLEKVIKENASLCRFGDGEFEIINGRVRPEFQVPNQDLAKRLREVLNDTGNSILVAIADNYGALDKYTDNAQNGIREYLSSRVREEHMQLLDSNKIYYDAYVSRPYIIYKDKIRAERIFNLWKMVWKHKDIVIVEGELSRCGYKNDLFRSANSVERILCAPRNAWSQYNKICSYISKEISKDKLILITLGPTATVLAYDLCNLGYQAIDIGQVDNEYEWYLKNVETRTNISYKYVSEYGALGRIADVIDDEEYIEQILVRIGAD